MKRLLFCLLCLLPAIAWAQTSVVQQKPVSADSNASNYNSQRFQYAYNYNPLVLTAPISLNAKTSTSSPVNGLFRFQLSDSTVQVWYNGHFVPFGGKGSSSAFTYATKLYFKGLGTQLNPITNNFDTIATVRYYPVGIDPITRAYRIDTSSNTFYNPNSVITGLSMSILTDSVTLQVAPGSWRINNVIYSKLTNTNFTLQPRDTVTFLSRYEVVYANQSSAINIAVGTASGTPIAPNIPANTVAVGTVLITPTGSTVIYPNAKTIYTGSDTLTSDRFVASRIYHLLLGDTLRGKSLLRIDPINSIFTVQTRSDNFNGGFDFQADHATFQTYSQYSNAGSGLYSDTTQYKLYFQAPDGNMNSFNFGAFTTLGKGLEVELDDPATIFSYRNGTNETAIRASAYGIPDMNLVRAIADSAASGGTTIYTGDGYLTGDRTVFGNGHILTLYTPYKTHGSYISIDSIAGIQINTQAGYSVKNSGIQIDTTVANFYHVGTSPVTSFIEARDTALRLGINFAVDTSQTFNFGKLRVGTKGIEIDDYQGYGLIATSNIDTAKMTSTPKAYVTSEWVTGKITASSGLTNANFKWSIVPSGSINSSNTAFVLPDTPTVGTVRGYRNGQRQIVGVDYTISGANITYLYAPSTGDSLIFDYMK